MSNEKPHISSKKRRIEQERQFRLEVIIKIAEDFFVSRGFQETMVEQIALKAGYSKATIFNYFPSKDDLFVAVVSKAFEKLFQIFQETFTSPEEKYELRALGEAYLIYIEKYPQYTGFLNSGRLSLALRTIIKKESSNEPLSESEQEQRYHQLKIEELLIKVVEETMKKSDVSMVVDPLKVVMALSSLDTAIRELVMRGKLSEDSEERSREYLDVLFTINDKGLKHYND